MYIARYKSVRQTIVALFIEIRVMKLVATVVSKENASSVCLFYVHLVNFGLGRLVKIRTR